MMLFTAEHVLTTCKFLKFFQVNGFCIQVQFRINFRLPIAYVKNHAFMMFLCDSWINSLTDANDIVALAFGQVKGN